MGRRIPPWFIEDVKPLRAAAPRSDPDGELFQRLRAQFQAQPGRIEHIDEPVVRLDGLRGQFIAQRRALFSANSMMNEFGWRSGSAERRLR